MSTHARIFKGFPLFLTCLALGPIFCSLGYGGQADYQRKVVARKTVPVGVDDSFNPITVRIKEQKWSEYEDLYLTLEVDAMITDEYCRIERTEEIAYQIEEHWDSRALDELKFYALGKPNFSGCTEALHFVPARVLVPLLLGPEKDGKAKYELKLGSLRIVVSAEVGKAATARLEK